MSVGKKERVSTDQLTDTCANQKTLLAAYRGELHHKRANVGPPQHFSTAAYVALTDGSFSSRLAKEEGREKIMRAPNRAIRKESLRKIVRERCTAYGKSEKKLPKGETRRSTFDWRHGTSLRLFRHKSQV